MGISVGIQGVLQAFRYALAPLIISLLRLCVLVMPIAYLFTLSADALNVVWWTFPIVEVITAAVSVALLLMARKNKVNKMD
jgi:Na+-driven multidrug efflux pump